MADSSRELVGPDTTAAVTFESYPRFIKGGFQDYEGLGIKRSTADSKHVPSIRSRLLGNTLPQKVVESLELPGTSGAHSKSEGTSRDLGGTPSANAADSCTAANLDHLITSSACARRLRGTSAPVEVKPALSATLDRIRGGAANQYWELQRSAAPRSSHFGTECPMVPARRSRMLEPGIV